MIKPLSLKFLNLILLSHQLLLVIIDRNKLSLTIVFLLYHTKKKEIERLLQLIIVNKSQNKKKEILFCDLSLLFNSYFFNIFCKVNNSFKASIGVIFITSSVVNLSKTVCCSSSIRGNCLT